MRIEETILENLVLNEEYSLKVLPFVQPEYFTDIVERKVFGLIKSFVEKYKALPSKESLIIEIEDIEDFTEDQYNNAVSMVSNFSEDKETNNKDWLNDQTETFCRDRALYNAIMSSVEIIKGKEKKYTKDAIPKILSDALAVSFDTSVGHDYIENSDARYDSLHRIEKRIPFDLEQFNTITKGGLPPKSLNIWMAGTAVGKSMFMCHHAANCLVQNKNVLYITLEMAEERIAERIDANIMDISMDDLYKLSKKEYISKLKSSTSGISGKLIVKEYPTACANVNHIRNLLSELKIKRGFVPDIIFVDYLNIMSSARIRSDGANSYSFVKSIAEELRGLAVEEDVPIVSATQVNRGGFSNSDFGLEDTSESWGLPATVDFMCALISTEELDENGKIMVKQLKNRYNDAVANRKFVIGVERSKMKFFDITQQSHGPISGSNQTDDMDYGHGFCPSEHDVDLPKTVTNYDDWNFEDE